MADDITTILIQRIISQGPGESNQNYTFNSSLFSNLVSALGYAASYAQILGTANGPLVQAAAINTVGGALQAVGGKDQDAQLQADFLSTASIAAGVGAGIVLIISIVLGALSQAYGSGSVESQELQAVLDEVGGLVDLALVTYWQDKFGLATRSWPPLSTDLDNLANEGLNGFYVKQDVGGFHDHASTFVNSLLPSKTLQQAEDYWERPILPNDTFAAQTVPYGVFPWVVTGWYGRIPQPESGPAVGANQMMAKDPRTMLPFLAVGLQSYISIQILVNFIDPGQPTIYKFLQDYACDFQDYLAFLYSNYQLAVNGIVKSDLPSAADRIGFLGYAAGPFLGNLFLEEGFEASPFFDQFWNVGAPTAGCAWNGVYGAVDTYPQFGAYLPSPPVPVPNAAPSYVIDLLSTDGLYEEWQQTLVLDYDYLFLYTVSEWVLPWLENRLILARMARWKALYLLNGYDQFWALLQLMQSLVARFPCSRTPAAPIPATMQLDQDQTIADGNWSVRELYSLLNFSGDILFGSSNANVNPEDLQVIWQPPPNLAAHEQGQAGWVYGYSVAALVEVFDTIGNGNWAGPPPYSVNYAPARTFMGNPPGPSRPLSFRDRLAAAAL